MNTELATEFFNSLSKNISLVCDATNSATVKDLEYILAWPDLYSNIELQMLIIKCCEHLFVSLSSQVINEHHLASTCRFISQLKMYQFLFRKDLIPTNLQKIATLYLQMEKKFVRLIKNISESENEAIKSTKHQIEKAYGFALLNSTGHFCKLVISVGRQTYMLDI